MNQVEAVRRALMDLGDVSHQDLAAFIGAKYGVMVRPQIVPILKATIKDQENLAEWRKKSRAVAEAHKSSLAENQPPATGGTEAKDS